MMCLDLGIYVNLCMRVVSFLSLSSYFNLQIKEPHETEEFEVNSITHHMKRGDFSI